MRVAVVDVGSNSTRLLIADVAGGRVAAELERRSTVTRLGAGVDVEGRLAAAGRGRVLATVAEYRAAIDAHGADTAVAVLTSAVRDAADGADFAHELATRFGLDARILTGDQEAELTFRGATGDRPRDGRELVVIDVGGGSTELVTGRDGVVCAAASTQAGVVRQTERHLTADPPDATALRALADEVAALFTAALPAPVRARVEDAVAVAGTPTSAAAMLQRLEPYDPARVQGFRVGARDLEELLARLAGMDLDQRRRIPGLHPDRAGVIVAGLVLLREALRAFDLDAVEVSEHDILRGAALAAAGTPLWTGI